MPVLLLALSALLALAAAVSGDHVLSLWLAACAGAPVGALLLAAFGSIPDR